MNSWKYVNAPLPVIWLFCLLVASTARAQDVLPYRVLSVNDGLVQQQVKALFKDSRGYLWIGTLGGVSKFNGETFENFTQREGLLSKQVFGIDEDAQGRIRIVTRKGISIYDGRQFISFPSPGKLSFFLHTDNQGRMVVAQNEGPTLIFDEGNYIPIGEVYPELEALNPEIITVEENGSRLVRDRKLRLWLVNGGKAELLGERNAEFTPYPTTIGGSPWLVVTNTMGKPVYLSSLQNGKLTRKYEFAPNIKLRSQIFDYRQDWFYYLDDNKQIIYQQHISTGDRKALLYDAPQQINTAWSDPGSHTVWIGTDQGLIQVFTSGFRQLQDPTIAWPWTIQEDDDGVYWIGNYRGGMIRYDGLEFEKTATPLYEGIAELQFYFGATRDQRGILYFPTQLGLLERSPQGVFDFKFSFRDENRSRPFLMSCYDPVADKVLLGGYRHLVIYDPITGGHDSIPLLGDLHGDSYCVSVARDSFDHYWGGSFYGLTRHHLPSRQTEHYLFSKGTLPVDGIISIRPDHRKTLWMGTTAGLGRWDYEGDSLALVLPGLFRANVTSLSLVDTTWMAIGAVDGLYLLHLPSYYADGRLRLRHYNHRNGFPGIEPEQNGGFVDSRGRLWIIASNGIFYIPHEELSIDKEPSKVLITSINRERLAFGRQDTVQVLPYGVNQLTVNFENVGPASTMHSEYSWKLEGFDQEFSPWSVGNTAIYNSLGPGRHTLVVRSRDPSAAGDEEHAVGRLVVRLSMPPWKWPNFYKWAFLGLVSLGVLSAALILLNRKAQLDIEEREKLIKYYQVQTLQAQLNPHFLKNLLANIQNFIRKESREKAVDQLLRLADMMDNFMESSIRSDVVYQNDHNEISLEEELSLLKYFLEFQQLQYPDVFDYRIEVDDDLRPSTERVPPMIIQPFVENAVEHGLRNLEHRKGNLWVRFRREGHGLQVTVEDDGIGRTAAGRRADSKTIGRLHRSRGTQLVTERVALLRELGHDIDIDIRDRPGGGTRVDIYFETL